MALAGVPQTFAFESARDMAEKLDWEIELYRREEDLQPKLWRAFNVAVTAWHISDWIWKKRKEAGKSVGKIEKFQEDVQRRSRALNLPPRGNSVEALRG